MTATRRIQLSDGSTFAEPDDWLDYMRKVITERELPPTFGINLKYDYAGTDRLVCELYDRLRGTGADVAMADACLHILETGTPEEIYAARVTPFADAPNACERLLRLVTTGRDRLVAGRMLSSVLADLMRLRPDDHRGIQLLTAEAVRSNDPYLYDLTATYASDWLIDHLPALQSNMQPLYWIGRTPQQNRERLVEVIVAKGQAYVARTIEPIVDPNTAQRARAELTARVDWHPEFARALAATTKTQS